MRTREYDAFLERRRSINQWDTIPQEDRILFVIFETVAPEILLHNHWLVPSKCQYFAGLLEVLNTEVGVVGPAPPHEDLSLQDPEPNPEEDFYSWDRNKDQSWLVDNIENLKYRGNFTIICNRDIPLRAAKDLISATGYGESPLWLSSGEWLSFISPYIEVAGWLYLVLPESTQYDLLVASEKFRNKISTSALMQTCGAAKATWSEGRAFWPSEPQEDAQGRA